MQEDMNSVNNVLRDLPEAPTSDDYRAALHRLLRLIQLQVPPMGEGQSAVRLSFLTRIARHDLGLARLVEGHLDATQILREAGRPPAPDKVYGIWASGGPVDTTELSEVGAPEEGFRLRGCKPFCSGSDIVDRALIYIYPSDQLVDVDMKAAASLGTVAFDGERWKSQAFSATHTWTVTFDSVDLSRRQFVGEKNWYFDRPGFCLGALGPSACWAGGAMGLVDLVRHTTLKDGHALAHLGAMVSGLYSMQALLRWGAEQVDADPTNRSGSLFPAALLVRHQIERGCTEVLDRFGRTLGPRPYVFDDNAARRIAELTIYIRQCHAERDLEELGGFLAERPELYFPGPYGDY